MNSGAGVFQARKIALVSALAILLLASSGISQRTDLWWFDSLQQFGASRAPLPADTALVLIDEHALAVMGQAPFAMRWPWPRAAFAAMMAGLRAAGAERIAVDLIFFENSAAAEQDLLLGAVAAGIPAVILATVPGRLPAIWPEAFRQQHPELFASAAKWGFVRTAPDADSVIRSYAPRGSLAEALLDAGAPGRGLPDTPVLLRWRGNLEQLRARHLPMLSAAPFLVAGWGILEQATRANPELDPAGLVAAIDAAPAPDGAAFKQVRGKTVFIGANAAATFDAIATPLGAPEPGVVLQWNAFASLQAGDFIQPVGQGLNWAVVLLTIVLLPLAGRAGLSLRRPALVAGAIVLLAVAASASLFFVGFWFAPALPVAAAAIGFTAVAAESFRVEHARKQEIQAWFGAYVSPAVVKRLVADPNAIELGGELRELTVSFSDIAGFTTISERLTPPELVTLINRLLEGQTECILEHGGYLDKYIGDAIMAVFGSPEPLENHAQQACRAALAGQVALEKFNDEIEGQYGMRLGMRTGINTGPVVVGNVGSTRKRNYTVLGDAVNLASRLEGANKETGTAILLGPATAAYAAEAMLVRPVARLQVKGKTQAVEVYELLAERSTADEHTVVFADTFTRGFHAYCERNFTAAAADFTEALGMRPDDIPSKRYLAQSRELEAAPPGPDWQAVLKLETK
ncbi:MAG TPA: adenylate/guanylate cyclase domain-containing protein [Xanthomonadales bacterium]|nr:adenylate/guanylate cyclase domain-containing protein [Xanthomonadales bacterium]